MKDSNVNKATRNTIYYAVKLAGKSSWNENQKLKAEGTIRIVPEKHMNFSPMILGKISKQELKGNHQIIDI